MTVELTAFAPVAVFFIVATLLAASMLVLSNFVGPRSEETLETFRSPYECGIHTSGFEVNTRYPIKFALIAIIFVLFDIELVFLVPWVVAAEAYQTNPAVTSFWYIEMLIFVVILLVGYAFILGKNIFAWEH